MLLELFKEISTVNFRPKVPVVLRNVPADQMAERAETVGSFLVVRELYLCSKAMPKLFCVNNIVVLYLDLMS